MSSFLGDAKAIGGAGGGGGAPSLAKYIVQVPHASLPNAQALSGLADGLIKNVSNVLFVATPGTDYYQPGGTDVAITDGGTGQSSRQAAIDALTDVAGATNEHVLTKDTGTGNAIFKVVPSAPVTSVFGRTGIVTAQLNDYSASLVGFTPAGNLIATQVQAALEELDTEKQPLNDYLTDISGLSPTLSNFIVGDGVDWIKNTPAQARTSLGLGTAALSNTGDFATAAQGLLADTAVQPGDLATVATTGDYGDLLNLPTLGTLAALNSPLPIANGGSGQTSQQAAINALTDVSAATIGHVLTKSAGGDAVFAAAAGVSWPASENDFAVSQDSVNAWELTFDLAALTAAREATWPDAAISVAGQNYANQFSQSNNFTGAVNVETANGLDYNPGSDVDADLITVGVTGSPRQFWDESNDRFSQNKGVEVTSGFVSIGASSTSSALTALNVIGGTPDTPVVNAIAANTISIFGDGSAQFRGRDVTNDIEFLIGTSIAGRTLIGAMSNHDLDLRTGNVTKAYIQHSDGHMSVAINFTSPNAQLHVRAAEPNTNTVANVIIAAVNSTGTAAAGFGPALLFQAESSTTNDTSIGRLSYEWATATHASRKGRGKLTAYDTAEREAIRWEAGGVAPMVGFLGAAAVARASHIVDPSGGGTQDAEARTAINAILVVLENLGFVATS